MIKRTILNALCATTTAILGGVSAPLSAQPTEAQPADLIPENGQFYTSQGFKQAIAVRNGVIEIVGSVARDEPAGQQCL